MVFISSFFPPLLFVFQVDFLKRNHQKEKTKNKKRTCEQKSIETRLNRKYWTGPLSNLFHRCRKTKQNIVLSPFSSCKWNVFAFGNLERKKREKSTLLYVHEQMNSLRNTKKRTYKWFLFIHKSYCKIKWKQQWLSFSYFQSSILSEHIFHPPPQTTSTLPVVHLLPEGLLLVHAPEGRH